MLTNRVMRVTGFILLCNSTLIAATTLPDLVCKVSSGVRLAHGDFTPQPYLSQDIYAISRGKLYLWPKDRDEYFYGDIRQVEPQRYETGHKTIIFEGKGFTTAVTVHIGTVETRILKLRCSEERKRLKPRP